MVKSAGTKENNKNNRTEGNSSAMKKIFFLTAAGFFVAAVFLAGYWYRAQEAGTAVSPAVSPASAGVAEPTDASSEDESDQAPGTVRIDADKQRIVGVQTDTAQRTSETHTQRVLGRVVADETRVYRINASVDGWIRGTYDDATTGSTVRKDQVLATFYSPDFLSAEQAYIYALGSMDRFQGSGKEPPQQITLTERNIQQYKDSLRTLGMSESQIAEIRRTRQYTENIEIRSPATGFVLLRNASNGERFEKGRELYRIADLRRVWILADLFENETQFFKPGKTLRVTLVQQKKSLTAKVSSVLPQFDAATRTLKVRLEAGNPGYVLRPDMFVDVEFPVTSPPCISVPTGAVLDSGTRKTVFVEHGRGVFEPRRVETGWRFGNRVEITRGLEPGERYVVSGNFLIDSESKMDLAAAGMQGTLSRDPVCGVDVSVRKAEKAGLTSVYRGKTFYFSHPECKQQFDQNPARTGGEEPVAQYDQSCH